MAVQGPSNIIGRRARCLSWIAIFRRALAHNRRFATDNTAALQHGDSRDVDRPSQNLISNKHLLVAREIDRKAIGLRLMMNKLQMSREKFTSDFVILHGALLPAPLFRFESIWIYFINVGARVFAANSALQAHVLEILRRG